MSNSITPKYCINPYKVVFETLNGEEKVFYSLRLVADTGLGAEVGLFHEIKRENIEALLRLADPKISIAFDVLWVVPKDCLNVKKTKRTEGIRFENLNREELEKVSGLVKAIGTFKR